MKKKNDWVYFILALVVVIVTIAFVCGVSKKTQPIEAVNTSAQEVAEQTQEVSSKKLDTSAIDGWCGNYCSGSIRMVGAWYYEEDERGITLEDEMGELWLIDAPVNPDDFVLLWLADNMTPEDKTDDTVVKVWVEAHW